MQSRADRKVPRHVRPRPQGKTGVLIGSIAVSLAPACRTEQRSWRRRRRFLSFISFSERQPRGIPIEVSCTTCLLPCQRNFSMFFIILLKKINALSSVSVRCSWIFVKMNPEDEENETCTTTGHVAKQLTPEEIDKIRAQDTRLVSDFQAMQLEKNAKKHWDLFYKRNEIRFFKDRHWTTREFEELLGLGAERRAQCLLEVGCGVGNLIYPLLEDNRNFEKIYACDLSPRAIEFVKVSIFTNFSKIAHGNMWAHYYKELYLSLESQIVRSRKSEGISSRCH